MNTPASVAACMTVWPSANGIDWPSILILPVTVVGTKEIVPNKTLWLFPGRARLVIHPAIETQGMTHDDLEGLKQKTRDAIGSALPADPA